jgi:TolB-like protein/DNA-binding winged helix-turn-helix (wHTH) protein/Tfp pilus assembly protein PilF
VKLLDPGQRVSSYSFLDFTLDTAAERLVRGGREIKLRPKSFQVMRYLVEHHGRLVTREELMKAVWGGVAVTDDSITKCVVDIRKALADDSQEVVRTVTRRGFIFEAEVRMVAPPAETATIVKGGRTARDRGLLIGTAILLLPLTAAVVWFSFEYNSRPRYEALAVLPFERLSGGEDQQFLADGMTEALITNLGQASPLRVIARTSVNQYQNTKKPVQDIARELNVDVVVEGTLTQLGDRIRVTANLIQVSPEKHIWARSYERTFNDVLSLQSEIAAAIAEEIHGKVAPGQPIKRQRPVNPEAQLAYSKARYFVHSRRTPEAARKSIEYSEQAIRLDPGYAQAHAGLALSYAMLTYMGAAPGEARASAKAAAERAIALDDDLAEAHVALGAVLFLYEKDWTGAEREFRRALSLNPSDSDARLRLASSLAAAGKVEEAVAEIKRARQLDPLSFLINREVGRMLYYARRYDEALVELRKAEEMQPNSSVVDVWVVKCLLQKGLVDDAIAADLRLRRNRDDFSEQTLAALQAAYAAKGQQGYWMKLKELVLPIYSTGGNGRMNLVDISLRLGDKEEALRWLTQTGNAWMKVDPGFEPLRSDPRFIAHLQRMGLAP